MKIDTDEYKYNDSMLWKESLNINFEHNIRNADKFKHNIVENKHLKLNDNHVPFYTSLEYYNY